MAGKQETDFERITRLAEAAGLLEVTRGTSYGTPALEVRGKSFVRMKEASVLVVMCALEEKEMLIELAPDLYFETDHYKGWPAMLVRLDVIGDQDLTQRLISAWRQKAPKRLASGFVTPAPN
ncbi:MmcQ/YjbR family DNA-binding protein [Pararhizobium sp. BT-229]|uniref:MmcQ/YjbR family DNA-binding protein n=1 Tax=Pararhizobium sp. BT-229 TaxID=2986923 RepID=UPI0021F7DDB7|nr:MmcQ/YjbR family DNA-binding protein [Pararhizobium sp. BT-229]MCV9963340.1 MmcQ/YjbR family DNA-binding protein [Pararhizobium sp. BT-229]